MDAKTFHEICLSITQLYPSLKSAKGIYMTDSVWHTASTSLCSLLQSYFSLSYFNLLNFIDSCLNCICSKFLFPFSDWQLYSRFEIVSLSS